MGPADDLPGGPAGIERRAVDRQPVRLEPAGHRLDPALAVAARRRQQRRQPRVAGVDQVADDVVLVVAVAGRDLDRRHDAYAEALPGGDGLVDAGRGVVIGQR